MSPGEEERRTDVDEIAARYRKIADQLTQRVRAVPADAWERPAPCEGWVARDVVGHLVEWIPGFFASYAGIEMAGGPSVDDDPAGAWEAVDQGLRQVLADPAAAGKVVDLPFGRMPVAEAVDMIVTGDVLVHTWDLARATGLDERLDPDEVRRLYERMGMFPEETLRSSGMYGPRVEVPDDADEQTRLLAYTGRRP